MCSHHVCVCVCSVYVTYGGSTGGRDSTVTVTIGGGETIAVGQDSYANRGLDPGTYYVFVRLFGVVSCYHNH